MIQSNITTITIILIYAYITVITINQYI